MTKGIIQNINNNILQIQLKCLSSCASCSHKSNCSINSTSAKNIEVKVHNPQNYQINQEVEVYISNHSIGISLFFAYILPLLLVLLVIGVMLHCNYSEMTSALGGLFVLPIYYISLIYINSWLKKQIKITIQ